MPSFTFLSYNFWILSYRRKIIGWARMKRSSTAADSCTCGKKPTEPVTSLTRASISPLHQGQAAQETFPPWMSEVPSWTVWLVQEFSLHLLKAASVIKDLHTRHGLLLPRLLFPFKPRHRKANSEIQRFPHNSQQPPTPTCSLRWAPETQKLGYTAHRAKLLLIC